MKYKVGDKVKIRTWEELSLKYGVKDIPASEGQDPVHYTLHYIPIGDFKFFLMMDAALDGSNCDRVMTIIAVDNKCYHIKAHNWVGHGWVVPENIIKNLVEQKEEFIPITSRFEILDL